MIARRRLPAGAIASVSEQGALIPKQKLHRAHPSFCFKSEILIDTRIENAWGAIRAVGVSAH